VKAPAFGYERPSTLEQAAELLRSEGLVARVLAGGQSLGPMLNLRLIAPDLLIDVTRIPELNRSDDDGDAVVLGACVTHAAIEDSIVIDGTRGVMAQIARGIAYRAVRNRGTIGGSLAHADPSADWTSSLAALGATVQIFGVRGRRSVPVAEFMVGVFATALDADEIVEAVRIPKLSARARWGFYKVCRKPGEFAEAMAAVLWDPERNVGRAAIGAVEAAPIIVDNIAQLLESDPKGDAIGLLSGAALRSLLYKKGLGEDSYALQIHCVALERALMQIRTK
jgi:aerobic carbon-monoxide dehydrogenase medium subunit